MDICIPLLMKTCLGHCILLATLALISQNIFVHNADAVDTPNLNFGVTINPELQISIRDEVNAYGRRTLFTGSGVEFGSVSFTHPELIGNGDAYIQNNRLMLEAVLNISIMYNGVNTVQVDLTKVAGSPNPFKNAYYDLSKNRATMPIEILMEPRANRLATMVNPGAFTLRLVFEVSPQQSGALSDRFRVSAISS